MGTPYYMAPEQVRGKEVTKLVDVYAFGILLFELMSGTKPFTADSIDQLFVEILQQPTHIYPLRLAEIPDAMCGLITECAEKDAELRIQSFHEIRQRLDAMAVLPKQRTAEQTITNESFKSEPAPTASRRGWIVWIRVAVVLALYPMGRNFSCRQASPVPRLSLNRTPLPSLRFCPCPFSRRQVEKWF